MESDMLASLQVEDPENLVVVAVEVVVEQVVSCVPVLLVLPEK